MRQVTGWIDEPNRVKLIGAGLHNRIHIYDPAVILGEKERINLTVVNIDGDEADLVSDKYIYPGEERTIYIRDLSAPVHAGAVVRSEWFERMYDDSSNTFGALYEKTKTVFRVWSPTATKMSVEVNGRQYRMKRSFLGTWERTVRGDLHGARYLYIATVQGVKARVIDPYTKSLTANSKHGVVLDLSKTTPKQFLYEAKNRPEHLQDSIIYELHVRDATVHKDSGVRYKGKFAGLTERNTTTSDGYPTGLNYISNLGVTHVQLLPVNDFARVDDRKPETGYNWGYDPLFFQAPEGSYATDPVDPECRICELKKLVHVFHEEELGVILDVVYNHVYIMEESPFEMLVPGYYFRYTDDGKVSNGTGVGNDIATERPMVRKFILDTIDYWLNEYNVDGFRFDLMGIMDIGTMQEIVKRTKEESKPIMLLGEGWDMPTALPTEERAASHQSHRLTGLRFFNDLFRDSIKGSSFHLEDRGYINGGGRYVERLEQLVSGSWIPEDQPIPPLVEDVRQNVNYVECHDNHTLWDRLKVSNPDAGELSRRKMHQLATAITILSQGVPFIHAGQEFYRTKYGDGNSYISGDDINQLDWQRAESFAEDVAWICKLIEIRNACEGFRKRSNTAVEERLYSFQTPEPVYGWMMFGYDEDIAVYLNPVDRSFQIQIPSLGNWSLMASNQREELFSTQSMLGNQTELFPYECLIVKKAYNS
ncbi:type I pullulanase [Salisediminibacterium halotolerans]|uniref:type I pullulanase n=1 Tax=Salisediminibacterium halotolerans TaxID=517425 RepID=UPI000F2316BE|nr:type I pullulanase [Salisediminibacterium halotolerans]RLJ69408.1 pullulanase [Actinophytocola xinjiangensis]RPE83966.1 pullulanase [Salisediminibacterium halotolerans]TWG32483.1 pullulanase [Salisediminibacterium halotolerans]GEL07676.1 type I pullulanase [Salisediminibacterium halotolerans]